MRKSVDKSPLTPDDWQRRAGLLYDDARLEARFESFERVCLPSILAQDDPAFRFIVLTSPELPAAWMERLAASCARSDAITLEVIAERDIHLGLLPLLARLHAEAGRNLIQFRLDDDDALARGAVARIRRLAARMADLPEFGVSLGNGLSVALYPGRGVVPLTHEQPFLGASTAVRMARADQSVFAITHARVPRRMTHLVERGPPGSLALKWPSDSGPLDLDRLPSNMARMEEAAFARVLARWFPWLAPEDFTALARMVETAYPALIAPAGPGIHQGASGEGQGAP